MPATVKGVYRNGRTELLETPVGVREGEVVVTMAEALASGEGAETREARRRALIQRLREGSLDLGGAPYPTREELHERGR